MSLPSMADAPFHCPPEIVIDLPMPPSVNRIWRANKAGPQRVSKSNEYKKWLAQADKTALAMGQLRGVKAIVGPFHARIVLQRQRGDLDNRAKGVLDWLQSRSVILDDKFCERLVLEWGEAPAGCRVTITAIQIKSMAQVAQRAQLRLTAP